MKRELVSLLYFGLWPSSYSTDRSKAFPLLQFFFVCASVISYVAFTVFLFAYLFIISFLSLEPRGKGLWWWGFGLVWHCDNPHAEGRIDCCVFHCFVTIRDCLFSRSFVSLVGYALRLWHIVNEPEKKIFQ